ncbi:MAG: phosphoglycerate dehydrogenase, partial [Gemmatimonadetes bacterium]|nr:phosphoglycerate dehydrogenase [Gemmatimonadota bacterium]
VSALANDHRRVSPGTLFFCVPGFSRDGHDFAAEAVARGAIALVVQRPVGAGVPEVRVEDVRAAMARAAARFHDDPSAALKVVGITGTNGKTTTAFLTRELLDAGTRLKVIGRAGVGVDNVDLDRATELGIAVINAPGGNVVSVAELVFGVLVSLFRHVHIADRLMREGKWPRSQLGGLELRGRTLSIVGLGRIGGEVARRGKVFGMKLLAYDPYVSEARFEEVGIERAATLEEALERADVVTLHVPLTDETLNMIGAAELARLHPGAIILNYARGGIIMEDALIEALQQNRILAAGIDVFAKEPLAPDHPIRSIPNILLTPHLGASTAEAQKSVSLEACAAVRDALVTGDLSSALNGAGVGGTGWGELRPLVDLAERLGRLGRALLTGGLSSMELRYSGPREEAPRALMLAALQGALRDVVEQRAINLVNAQHVAAERGIETSWTRGAPQAERGEEVELRMESGDRTMKISGALLGESHGRITRIGPFRVDIAPRGTLLVLRNRDVPGVIGRVGSLLGDEGVNIAEYHQARLQVGGEALAAVTIDTKLPAAVVQRLSALPEVLDVRQVEMEESAGLPAYAES